LPEALLVSFLSEAQEAQGEETVKQALNRALKRLEKAKASQEDLVQAVYQAVADNLTALTFGAVNKPKADRRKGDDETAVIVFSDLQLGQVTNSYNSEVAEQRVQQYAANSLCLRIPIRSIAACTHRSLSTAPASWWTSSAACWRRSSTSTW
jgi:hypothetical protein